MTVLSVLTADIADDIDDTTGEYGDQILKAVQGAQRFCERSTYYFNETRDETFVTINLRDWYDDTDNASISTLIRIQTVYVTESSGNTLPMDRSTPDELEFLGASSGAYGKPYCWTYFKQKIRLYPIPDSTVYTIRLQLGPFRLGALMNPGDNNAWLDEAYELIKARAKYLLYKNTLKDAGLAIEAKADWAEQDLALAAETSSRKSTGTIQATSF